MFTPQFFYHFIGLKVNKDFAVITQDFLRPLISITVAVTTERVLVILRLIVSYNSWSWLFVIISTYVQRITKVICS